MAGAGIYFLRHVIHDWPGAEAVQILKGCASVMRNGSKLLICEHVVCPTFRFNDPGEDNQFIAPEPPLANWGDGPTSRLDLQVYICLTAKQRTKQEYQELAAEGAFCCAMLRRLSASSP